MFSEEAVKKDKKREFFCKSLAVSQSSLVLYWACWMHSINTSGDICPVTSEFCFKNDYEIKVSKMGEIIGVLLFR